MKRSLVAFAMLAAALAAPAATEPTPVPELQPMKVIKGDPPVYPQQMIQLGVREGEAKIAFSIDPQGNLEDCLAVEYTHPEFARVTLGAIKRWKFEPARYRGAAIGAVSQVTARFESRGGVIVSLTPMESLEAMFHAMAPGDNEYHPHSLKEIDRIPTPIAAPAPHVPQRMVDPTLASHVTVSFYIDEQGTVRLPSVEIADNSDLGALALDAIRRWKFEPPTYKGRPVLVRASQRFNFHVTPHTSSASKNSG